MLKLLNISSLGGVGCTKGNLQVFSHLSTFILAFYYVRLESSILFLSCRLLNLVVQ